MNMHEFQRRLHSRFGEEPVLRLVRTLTAVAIEPAKEVMSDPARGWFVWNETTEPAVPGGGGLA